MGSTDGGLAVLTMQYKVEFEQGIEELRKQFEGDFAVKMQEYGQAVKDLEPTLNRMKDTTVDALKDVSPMENVDTKNMFMWSAWTAVMLVGMAVGYALGRYLLWPLVGMFLSPFALFLVAYIALPATACYYLSYPVEETPENDKRRRHYLLGFALVEGVLEGTLFANWALSGWGPIPAVSGAVIVVVLANGMAFVGNDRTKFLGAALGGGIAVHLVLGVVVGLSMPFLLLAILYAAAGFVTIQLYIRNITKEKVFAHVYMVMFVCLVMFGDLLVMGLLGGDATEVADANAEAKAASDAADASNQ